METSLLFVALMFWLVLGGSRSAGTGTRNDACSSDDDHAYGYPRPGGWRSCVKCGHIDSGWPADPDAGIEAWIARDQERRHE